MAPETRSHGKPPAERIYHSSPSLQQLQFPARRRRVVHAYGKSSTGSNHTSPRDTTPSASGSALRARDPRQKTLTQIDWVSSSAAPEIVLSDSEEEKENELPTNKNEDEEDEEPISSGKRKRQVRVAAPKSKDKRRRTLGDEAESIGGKKKKNDSRRKTFGDTPLSSKYHTQTLTQLVGREVSQIKDSEDEDDGFDDWLAEPQSPSPRAAQLERDSNPTKKVRRTEEKAKEDDSSRQSSVVPQTPAKRLRFEIPSSSQASTPISLRMMNRYGAPDKENTSPSGKSASQVTEPVAELAGQPKPVTARKLVIEDSFATDGSLGSAGTTPIKATPLKDITADVVGLQRQSSSATETVDTPTKSRRRNASAELGEKTPTKKSVLKKTPSPTKVSIGGVFEIPDSDEDDGEYTEDEEDESDRADENTVIAKVNSKAAEGSDPDQAPEKDETIKEDDGYVAGPETQVVMNELASSVEASSAQATRPGSMGPPTSTTRQPQPPTSTPSVYGTPATHPVASQQLPPPAPTQTPIKSAPRPKPQKPLRKPVRHNPPSSQTQPLESQRVALDTIQSFGQPTNRTDIFLPTDPSTIANLTGGHALHLFLPFKVPTQVARFWLFDGSLLRYAACVKPGDMETSSSGRNWSYYAAQIYELNNPLDMDDMREEGWIEDEDLQKQYTYLPPVGVSQLLANLRHALFSDDPEYNDDETQEDDDQDDFQETEEPVQLPPANPGSSFSVSQAVEAQLQSDIATHTDIPSGDAEPNHIDPEDAILVPSTPLKNRTPRPQVYPSQATTASQTSTPEKSQAPGTTRRPPPLTPSVPAPVAGQTPARNAPGSALPPQSSSSAYTFPDHDDSPPLLLQDSSAGGISLRSSQLLTKSQMLPDSLVRDDTRMPPQIWDLDEEDEP